MATLKLLNNNSPKRVPCKYNYRASPVPNFIGETSEQAHEVFINTYKNQMLMYKESDEPIVPSEAEDNITFVKEGALT